MKSFEYFVVSEILPTTNNKTSHNIRKALPNQKVGLEFIPLWYEEHMKYLEKIDEDIVCSGCQVSFRKGIAEDVLQHLKDLKHWEMCKVSRKRIRYECEICPKIYHQELSYEKHIEATEHLNVINKLGNVRKAQVLISYLQYLVDKKLRFV